MARRKNGAGNGGGVAAKSYRHPEATNLMRPEVGTQAQFRKKKPPKTYRYDSSLSPAMDWDGQNPAREFGEWLLATIEAAAALPDPHQFDQPRVFKDARGHVIATVAGLSDAVGQLKRLGKPFLDWAGKAERLSFDVPTLPLFVHERLSTQAILQTFKSHQSVVQEDMLDLFGDPGHPIHEQVLRAYEHKDNWVNRLILGDSLVVMNSLVEYEGLAGQVQMIYMDPPYGIKFGSNFQPFVRKRDVTHNEDEDFTREPEMVKAYRDTWSLGIHSYLSYLRDHISVARDLLTPKGSMFVQISDENLHHVREVLDEIFGPENFVSIIPFRKKTMPLGAKFLESVTDYILWYAKDIEKLKFNPLYEFMSVEGDSHWNYVELPDGSRRKMTKEEMSNHSLLPAGSTPIQLISLYPAGVNQSGLFEFKFRGKSYFPPDGNSWFTNQEGMQRLAEADRIEPYEDGETIRYVLKLSDSPVSVLTNLWSDTSAPNDKIYAVQTSNKVLQRCILMTTEPGDLVLDQTCGSGTTAYVAEQWGRRWIAIDTSRVPLALTRQRLLTATFSYYELKNPTRGPIGGFIYSRKQNRRGEEVGGIIPYITKGSIANREPVSEAILFDRPDMSNGIVRVTGPFSVEATIPTPIDWEGDGEEDSGVGGEDHASFLERMLEVLRQSPVLHLGGGKTVSLRNIRLPAKTLSLSAEAVVDATAAGTVTLDDAINEAVEKSDNLLPFSQKTVAIVFGPENGAVSEKLVYEAAREAHAKGYQHLYVIGFAIQPNARKLVEDSEAAVGVPSTYVQATPDLMMGDLLKNMRSSQIFSVCGLPEIKLRRNKDGKYQVEVLGLDVFDPATMEIDHRQGDDVPCWMLDQNYNGLCFHARQVFFPRTAAWDSLKRSLKAEFDDNVWDHLAGTVSYPFEAGEEGQIAVKVIDDRGNELLIVKSLKDAEVEKNGKKKGAR
ncbi:site-specific DNA-methyltransferase [bacterium]|nr:site-specific DNA-methyltransferase [bacterium]